MLNTKCSRVILSSLGQTSHQHAKDGLEMCWNSNLLLCTPQLSGNRQGLATVCGTNRITLVCHDASKCGNSALEYHLVQGEKELGQQTPSSERLHLSPNGCFCDSAPKSENQGAAGPKVSDKNQAQWARSSKEKGLCNDQVYNYLRSPKHSKYSFWWQSLSFKRRCDVFQTQLLCTGI